MKGFVCLLRGINVGGAHKIKMAELRTLLSSNGFENVTTYIQSGNILFKSTIESTSKIDYKIKSIIKHHYGYDLNIMTLSINSLDEIIASNPFLNGENDYSKLLVTVFQTKPSKTGTQEVQNFVQKTDERLDFKNRFMFLHCPNGYGKTKLTGKLLDRKLGTRGTTRNWKTILKLEELSQAYR